LGEASVELPIELNRMNGCSIEFESRLFDHTKEFWGLVTFNGDSLWFWEFNPKRPPGHSRKDYCGQDCPAEVDNSEFDEVSEKLPTGNCHNRDARNQYEKKSRITSNHQK
jgi:hypothetical protein